MPRTTVYKLAFVLCLLAFGVPGFGTAQAADPPAAVQELAAGTPRRLGPPTRDGRELLDLRTRSSRTFLQEDGTRRMLVSAAPVNFRNERGEWQPLGNRLRISAAPGYTHENTANSYDLQLPADLSLRPVRFELGGEWIAYSLNGARGSGVAAGNSKTYRHALAATDVRLRALPDSVKEELILRNASAPSSFSYTVEASQGVNARANRAGGIDFMDEAGTHLFSFSPPYARDSSGLASGRVDLRYRLRQVGERYSLSVALDPEWLRNPNRKWPVIVDPSVIWRSASRDCFITGGSSANTSFCRDTFLSVGWDGTKASRALL